VIFPHASAATIKGLPGAVWAMDGGVRAAFVFTIEDGKIERLEIVMEPEHLATLDVIA
jgi:hypothetical protein